MNLPTGEIWIPIPYGVYYFISDQGNIYSTFINQCMKNSLDDHGYRIANLYHRGVSRTFKIHRLVLEAFVGPCPKGMECYHKDNDRANNRLDNLKWATSVENTRYVVTSGNNHNRNKDRCPKSHLFKGKNLKYYPSKPTWRQCASCLYGAQAHRFNPSRDATEEANKYYAALGIE